MANLTIKLTFSFYTLLYVMIPQILVVATAMQVC